MRDEGGRHGGTAGARWVILQSTGQNEAAVLELGEAFKALDSL